MSQNNLHKRQVILFAATMAIIITVIISLKILTSQSSAPNIPQRSIPAKDNIATPDTTTSETTIPDISDTTIQAASELVGRDTRPADEAGAEDGYWNGYHDGATGGTRNEYDDTSDFPTAAERSTYAENYHEGYERGYREGLSGEQPAEKEE